MRFDLRRRANPPKINDAWALSFPPKSIYLERVVNDPHYASFHDLILDSPAYHVVTFTFRHVPVELN